MRIPGNKMLARKRENEKGKRKGKGKGKGKGKELASSGCLSWLESPKVWQQTAGWGEIFTGWMLQEQERAGQIPTWELGKTHAGAHTPSPRQNLNVKSPACTEVCTTHRVSSTYEGMEDISSWVEAVVPNSALMQLVRIMGVHHPALFKKQSISFLRDITLHFLSSAFSNTFLYASRKNPPLDVFQSPCILLQGPDNYWWLNKQRHWDVHQRGRYQHGFVATANFVEWGGGKLHHLQGIAWSDPSVDLGFVPQGLCPHF